MKVRPIVEFLLSLVIAAPTIAIAGAAAWGNWVPANPMVAGALVVWTGRRALVPIRESVPSIGGIQMRMKAVVWMVEIATGLLSAISAVWLGWSVVG